MPLLEETAVFINTSLLQWALALAIVVGSVLFLIYSVLIVRIEKKRSQVLSSAFSSQEIRTEQNEDHNNEFEQLMMIYKAKCKTVETQNGVVATLKKRQVSLEKKCNHQQSMITALTRQLEKAKEENKVMRIINRRSMSHPV